MQVGLHVAKVWVVCALVAMAVVAALGFAYAVVDRDWRDRLTGGTDPVTVTITGQQRNEFGCGTKYKRPGWDWQATWVDGEVTRSGSLEKCDQAPAVGSQVGAYVTSRDELVDGGSTEGYYQWWVVVGLGLGTLFAFVWLRGHGRAAYEAVRAEVG